MKVKVGLLMILVVIVPSVLLAQGTSHLVYGTIVRWEGDNVPDECLYFWAYRINHPQDTLFNWSPGCGYTSGHWYIQVASFPTEWGVGDTLRIIFADSCILERAGINIVLSDEASQEYGETVVLSPIGGVRPVLVNGSVTPGTGFVTTGFVYHVLYTHAGRVAPRSVKVTVDGVEYTMIPDPDSLFLDYQIGCWFRTASPIYGLAKNLTHTYSFSATDEYGNFATGDVFVHSGPVVLNSPPQITTISIAPPVARESDTIFVSVTTNDADGDYVDIYYQWYNTRGIIEGASNRFITGEYFSKHDTVYCYISTYDGETYGDEGYSAYVPILNTAPTSPIFEIVPYPSFDNDTLNVNIITQSTDIDGDTVEYLYEWYVNSWFVSSEPFILPDEFAPGDTVRCVVSATDNDGGYSGDVVRTVIIDAPYLADGNFDPSTGRATTPFNFTVTYYNQRNIPPEMVFVNIGGELYYLEQLEPEDDNYVDGAIYYGTFTLRRGEYRVSFGAVDENGNMARGIDEFAGPVVLNSPPEIYDAYLTPAVGSRFVSGVPIIVRVGSVYDPDDDPVMLLYKWYRNGERLTVGSDRLDPYYFRTGDTIWCEVYPYDGALWGPYLTTPPVVIQNTEPTPPSVRITPQNPTTLDSLQLVITSPAFDPDGDPITYYYHWYKNNAYVDEIDGPVVSAEYTEKGDIWRCYVLYTDGINLDSVYAEVTIGNHAPVLQELPPSAAVDTIPYDVTISAYDPDNDDFWAVLVEGPEGLRIEGLRIVWLTPIYNERPYVVRFFLTDGSDRTETYTFDISVMQLTNLSLAPSNLFARSGYYSVVPLSWDPPEILTRAPYLELGLRGYIVERGIDNESFEQVAFVADTRYLDVNLVPGTTYFYRVRAQYETFLSAYSNTVSAVPGEPSGYLYSSFNYNPDPSIDGALEENEWASAARYTFGSYTIYLMNTNEAMFVAIINGGDRTLSIGDEVLISIDDNHSGSWPETEISSEGEYRLTYTGEESRFIFQRVWSYDGVYRSEPLPVSAGMGAIGMSETGVIYEVALRLDENPEIFDAIQNQAGYELGFRFAVNNSETPGWEFALPAGSNMDDPLTFGTIYLSVGGYPSCIVSPLRFDVEAELNTSVCFPLLIRNVGDAPLYFNITEDYRPAGVGPMANPERVKVLVLTDTVEPSMRWVLDYLGYQGDIVNGAASFLAALRAETYEIIVVVLRGEIPVDNGIWDAVRQFVASGGKAVIATPNIESTASNELWALAGVEFATNLGERRSGLSWVDAHHPIFNAPFMVPAIPRIVGRGGDFGDGIRVTTATPLAKFDILPEPENVAIAISHDRKIIINSFLFDGIIDRNGDGINDLAQLLVNEIRFASPVSGLPWLSEEPASGTIPVNGNYTVNVCFNNEGLLADHTYSGYLVVRTNAPDARIINIPVTFTPRIPEIHTLTMWFEMPVYEVAPGTEFSVPVYINDCSGWDVKSIEVKLKLRGRGFGFDGVRLNRVDGPAAHWDSPVILEHTRDAFRFRISGESPLESSGVLFYINLHAEHTSTVGNTADLLIESVLNLNPDADVDNFSLGSTELRVRSGVYQWLMKIIATYDGISDTLYIGLDPLATPYFDPTFDLECEDTTRTFIYSIDPEHPYLIKDMRCECNDEGDGIVWRIRTTRGSGKLEWTLEDVENPWRMGTLFLNSRLDMKRNNVYFFSAGEELTITYRSDGKVPFWYHVYPGFNMVSLPIELISYSVDYVFPDTIGITQRAYRYDTRERRWISVSTVEPGVGYAVLFSEEKEFYHWGYPINYLEIPVNQGWNLIGSTYQPILSEMVMTEPASILLPGFNLYNPVLRRYVLSSTIEPGYGYFVGSNRDGIVKLGAGRGKSFQSLPERWSATIEAVNERGGKTFLIGSADNELFFPELPQIVGTQFELYMMVESEPAYCSYKSGDAKWEFVNKLESPVSLVASGNMGLVIRLDDKEIALGTTPVTIPAKRDFVIYRKEGAEVPKKFYISSPYPNPFNTETKIALGLPERVDVRFEVMNILGEKVKSVEYEKLEGDVILRWDGTDSYNKPVSSGLYLIRVVAGKEEKIAPTLLIK